MLEVKSSEIREIMNLSACFLRTTVLTTHVQKISNAVGDRSVRDVIAPLKEHLLKHLDTNAEE